MYLRTDGNKVGEFGMTSISKVIQMKVRSSKIMGKQINRQGIVQGNKSQVLELLFYLGSTMELFLSKWMELRRVLSIFLSRPIYVCMFVCVCVCVSMHVFHAALIQ